MITAALITLSIAAVLLVVYLRGHGKRDRREKSADPFEPKKFDTTLGEFHDMREALRPLQHARAASRRHPSNQTEIDRGVG